MFKTKQVSVVYVLTCLHIKKKSVGGGGGGFCSRIKKNSVEESGAPSLNRIATL